MSDDAMPEPQQRPTARWVVAAVVVAAIVSQHRSLYRLGYELGITVFAVKMLLAAAGAVVIWRYRSVPRTWPVPGGRHCYSRLTIGTTSVLSATFMVPFSGVLVVFVAALTNATSPDQALPIGASGSVVFRDILSTVVAPAFAEEAIYRLLLLGLLIRIMSPRRAVVVQAVVFTLAHTDFSLLASMGGGSTTGYSLASSVGVAANGLLYGFLVVELGRLLPAMVIHGLHNLLVSTAVIAPWLSDVAVYSALAATCFAAMHGIPGLVTEIIPTERRAAGLTPAFQLRLIERARPLIARSPEIRRPLYWVAPRLVDRLMVPPIRRTVADCPIAR
jgi:membrane protease YdiL (CAAX protease family)